MNDPAANFGPYNLRILEGGIGVTRPLAPNAAPVAAGTPWTISGWVQITRVVPGEVSVVVVGEAGGAEGGARRALLLQAGVPALELAPGALLRAAQPLNAGAWHAIAASYDGSTGRLYVDGRPAGELAAATASVAATLEIAPAVAAPEHAGGYAHFAGRLADLRVTPRALDAAALRASAAAPPDFGLLRFHEVGVGWPLQERAWRGLQEPQDPWTLPRAKAAGGAPHGSSTTGAADAAHASAAPVQSNGEALRPLRAEHWTIENWHLREAPAVQAAGAELSLPGYQERQWYAAIVPGTVLTTLIARGVYPDSDYGLNNLAIPDSLCRQDYWYRTTFVAPATLRGRESTLTFRGINYAADVWLNGVQLGQVKGAFIRGVFDVTAALRPGERNTLAVRISPPPHPGIPHEQSVAAGPGENGGALALDGPTFIATEGWDWIPGIRDRDIGLWQPVELAASGALRLHDVHVVTRLPLPRIDSADIEVTVPLENRAQQPAAATLSAEIDGVRLTKTLTLPPGLTEVRLDPKEFPQLHLQHPRLWWPNGYGAAELYTATLRIAQDGVESDARSVRFGVRQLTYELSLFDHEGRLRRVEVDPTLGSARGERLVDGSHQAIIRTPDGWAQSLTKAGESSPAVRPVATDSLTPYLVIRVNGVPIAARGGSWGMDDSRKRSSREHLEPFFEMHREAHVNIIRNWLGQNTEEVFYDLADEYGMLVLNDFWVSTQDFQLEPQDPALFLANARDVMTRYRNHPSIAVWFGRNEGVPQPILNEGLAELNATLDGTRLYTGSSNSVNLQGSGPYNYRPPEQYFTTLARGFSVEVGTPSLSTIEALRASIPAPDLWPLGDVYAYHDWHFGGNGDVATFMAALSAQYGAATSLEDFERKAQLMDYVSYRAIFEGFLAHLWTQNSGRLLWMTHPSWPSNTWQIYSSDYDTAAAYYAVKKACEPIHAQLDLPDYRLTVGNTTREDAAGLTLTSRIVSLDNRALGQRVDRVDARANSIVELSPLDLAPLLERERLVLVKLSLADPHGRVLSDNVYWQSRDAAGQRLLNDLKPQRLGLSARSKVPNGGDQLVEVLLSNDGDAPALAAKLTVLDSAGKRVLPAFYSDNYVTLLPGESRKIDIRCPQHSAACTRIALRGWNVEARESAVETQGSR